MICDVLCDVWGDVWYDVWCEVCYTYVCVCMYVIILTEYDACVV